MATLQDVQAQITALQTHIDSETAEVSAMIQALMDKIAAGITPEQADSLVADLSAMQAKVDAISGPTAP